MAAQQKYKLITQDENQVWPHLNRKPQSHSYLLLIGQPKLKLVSLSKVYFSNSQIWCFKHMILRVVQIDIRNKSKSGFWSPPSPSKCHSMCIRESIFSFNLSACSRLGQKEWEKYIYIYLIDCSFLMHIVLSETAMKFSRSQTDSTSRRIHEIKNILAKY